MSDITARRAAFRKLHESGCFVIPNPWDIGSARYLQHAGFKALATTSSGFAFSRGRPDSDSGVPRDRMLSHFAEMVAAVDLPVNADFRSGYADQPEDVAANVKLCVATGVAGLSIEDSTGDHRKPLYEHPLAVQRIEAARTAIDETGADVLLVARAECYLVDHPEPFRESIRRLQSYAEAGADVLYAPGVRDREEIRSIVQAVSPKPVNVLMHSGGMKLNELQELGVRRISVGSSLARAAWTGFIRAARMIAETGDFSGFDGSIAGRDLNNLFQPVPVPAAFQSRG